MHNGFTDWLGALLTEQCRTYVVAVFAGISRQPGADNRSAGGHKISQADKLVGGGSGRDFAWPTGNEGFTMASVPKQSSTVSASTADEVRSRSNALPPPTVEPTGSSSHHVH